MRKTIFHILLLSLFSIGLNAQVNLVPNPSFEDTIHCPSNEAELYNCTIWHNPTAGSPDYFNSCTDYTSGFVSVPQNPYGSQYSHSGNAYAGIYALNKPTSNAREYLQIKLSDSLRRDSTYCISFYVSLAELTSNTAITELGMYFSSTAITLGTYYNFPYTPQLTSPPGYFLADTTGWMEIGGHYTANGGEQYITIGNFKTDANTDTTSWGLNNPSCFPNCYQETYYYIDDITVKQCDTTVGIQSYNNNLFFKLYPNPNNGAIQLEYSVKPTDKVSIKIYNVTGELVEENVLNPNTNRSQLNTDLMDGIYLYQVLANDHIMKSDKLVIIR